MTTTSDNTTDLARAVELDAAHATWSTQPWKAHVTFGQYAISHLRERGLEICADGCDDCERDCECAAPQPVATGQQLADLLGLLDTSPYTMRALAMPVEEIADLLAALAEHDLRWTRGENGRGGTLTAGQAEPADLHVVFDCYRAAWQRDNERARDDGDPCAHWFGPNGARRAWTQLQRTHDPLTPDGGIAPPPTRDEP